MVMEEMENTHRNYDFYEFAYSNIIKDFITKYLQIYRDKYDPTLLEKNSVSDLRADLTYLTLIEELKYYYNNDLCVSVITGIATLKNLDFDLRVHAYYLENAIFRIANMWEYIHIAINSMLGLDLIVGKDTKMDLIKAGCYEVEFIKAGHGYRPVYKAVSEIIAELTWIKVNDMIVYSFDRVCYSCKQTIKSFTYIQYRMLYDDVTFPYEDWMVREVYAALHPEEQFLDMDYALNFPVKILGDDEELDKALVNSGRFHYIKRVCSSKHHKKYYYANICPHCECFLGNYHLREYVTDNHLRTNIAMIIECEV